MASRSRYSAAEAAFVDADAKLQITCSKPTSSLLLAPLRLADGLRKRLLIGVDRK
jgi:hypothetical protein